MARPLVWIIFTISVIGRAAACPDNWQEHEGKCYVSGSQSATWEEARLGCEMRGGQLASIHNVNESNFLKEQFAGGAWIGLVQVNNGAPYEWSDGTPVNYENWKPGEPSNADGFERCVRMGDGGGWNDGSCTSQRPSICQQDRTVGETSAETGLSREKRRARGCKSKGNFYRVGQSWNIYTRRGKKRCTCYGRRKRCHRRTCFHKGKEYNAGQKWTWVRRRKKNKFCMCPSQVFGQFSRRARCRRRPWY